MLGIIGLVVAAFILIRLPAWRLARVLARPMPAPFIAILTRNLPVYSRMPRPLQTQLRRLVSQMLYQKTFVGCGGLKIDDEIRVTIAGQACLLLLNRPTKVYPRLHTILVYPGAFAAPRTDVADGGVITHFSQGLLGESWEDGRVILSWEHVQAGISDWRDGHNIVLHEFAHQLDSESGSNNGAPFLGDQAFYRNWSAVLSREFTALKFDAMYQQDSVLDHYGATNPAEFFAVATETFFEKSVEMAEHHPELFAQFEQYYRVDPRTWTPTDDAQTEVAPVLSSRPDVRWRGNAG